MGGRRGVQLSSFRVPMEEHGVMETAPPVFAAAAAALLLQLLLLLHATSRLLRSHSHSQENLTALGKE